MRQYEAREDLKLVFLDAEASLVFIASVSLRITKPFKTYPILAKPIQNCKNNVRM